jgi:hypothetical protein
VITKEVDKAVYTLRGAGVVDGRASSDAACHTGGPASIPGPGQTYVLCGKEALFCNPVSWGMFSSTAIEIIN